jgi:hypothetical protein
MQMVWQPVVAALITKLESYRRKRVYSPYDAAHLAGLDAMELMEHAATEATRAQGRSGPHPRAVVDPDQTRFLDDNRR